MGTCFARGVITEYSAQQRSSYPILGHLKPAIIVYRWFDNYWDIDVLELHDVIGLTNSHKSRC